MPINLVVRTLKTVELSPWAASQFRQDDADVAAASCVRSSARDHSMQQCRRPYRVDQFSFLASADINYRPPTRTFVQERPEVSAEVKSRGYTIGYTIGREKY